MLTNFIGYRFTVWTPRTQRPQWRQDDLTAKKNFQAIHHVNLGPQRKNYSLNRRNSSWGLKLQKISSRSTCRIWLWGEARVFPKNHYNIMGIMENLLTPYGNEGEANGADDGLALKTSWSSSKSKALLVLCIVSFLSLYLRVRRFQVLVWGSDPLYLYLYKPLPWPLVWWGTRWVEEKL